LPPYGWWVREYEHKTVLRGWDWMRGAFTLLHGTFTLPLTIWIAKSDSSGTLIWLAVSLFVAAGVGWAVVVDKMGFVLCRTWLGFPMTSKRLPRGISQSVDEDFGAPDGADFGRFIRLGADDDQFGARPNADRLKAKLDEAVGRHHR